MKNLILLLVSLLAICENCMSQDSSISDQMSLYQQIKRTTKLYQPVPKPGPNDWLKRHKESGQTFAQYSHLTRAASIDKSKIFYIQPIGKFNAKQQEILELTQQYLSLFYQLTVKFLPAIQLSAIPAKAQRKNPHTKQNQLLTTYLLYKVLKKNFPKNAALVLGLTGEDLYPATSWNFVFGQASLHDKVGIWSMNRFGDPRITENFHLCLLRTFKTATHETGHMLGIHHCIAYHCNMGGSNHLIELDQKPVWFCPECTTKVCWRQTINPQQRYQALEQFWKQQGFKDFRRFYKKARKIVD